MQGWGREGIYASQVKSEPTNEREEKQSALTFQSEEEEYEVKSEK